jgi:predicted permease
MRILRRLSYFLRQRRAEAELAEELEFHRLMNKEMGGDPRAMGNMMRAYEDARAVWIWPWLQSVWQDVAYALRNLRRQPGFTLVALLTLGTAIGLNTSLFTVFNLIALHPWPVKDAARLIRILQNGSGFSLAEYRDLAAHAEGFAGLAIKRDSNVRLGDDRSDDRIPCTVVSGNYFRLLGVEMELGRGFLTDEDRRDAPEPVVVLSNSFWLEHFGGDPQIIDKQIRIEGREFTIVGVTARSFTLGGNLWLPLSAMTFLQPLPPSVGQAGRFAAGECCFEILGRLAVGQSAASAQAGLAAWSRGFAQRSGQPPAAIEVVSGLPAPEGKTDRIMALFGLMEFTVLLVLVLTCANLANLLLARAEARRQEIYARFCLGAGRGRIVRQLLTESLVLALSAAALGIALAYRLPHLVLRQFHQQTPSNLTPNGAVLAYALGLAVFSCLGFGLAPALQGTRTVGPGMRLRNILMAVEAGVTVVLLIGASVLTKAVTLSRTTDPGFSIADVTVVEFEFPAGHYDADGFHARLTEKLDTATGLPAFGLAEQEPLTATFRAGAATPYGWIHLYSVSPGYFDVLRIPIVAGRNLDSDREDLILVNETMARQYWKGDAIGRRFKVGDHPREVVGVVKDTFSTPSGLERIDPLIYELVPHRRTWASGYSRGVPKVLIRSAPGAVESVSALAVAIDSRVRVQAGPLAERVDRWLEPARTGAAIARLIGIFALVLATVGMAGVFGFVVEQRRREIGIRMALGAQPRQVVAPILFGASRAVWIGLAFGFLAAGPISTLMRLRLAHVSPLDPSAYWPAALALALAALAAAYVPARRATRIDPMCALRCE